MKNNSNIRIIDIARLAGVSTGTVDRILHNRGKVSDDKRAKVEKVLKEIDYKPNMVARFLATQKNYKLAVIAPSFQADDYWELANKGINQACDELDKFNISIEYYLFDQYDRQSFQQAAKRLNSKDFDGVLIATLFEEHAILLSEELDKREIPYIYIDSNIQEQNDLAYFGGDSFASGRIAAKLLLKEIGIESDIYVVHIKFKHNEISVQMKTREAGFSDYLKKNAYTGNVHHIELDTDDENQSISILQSMLKSIDRVAGCIVLNSRIYELVNLLDKIDTESKSKLLLIGHEALDRNVKALKENKVFTLLSQHPELQGYSAIKALGNHLIFNEVPEKINYMPIDILIKENVDFYKKYKP